MNEIFLKLKHKLVVSCQAEGNSPFNSPEGVTMFAIAAQQGGASAIRSEGIHKTKKIIDNVSLPVIGLIKTYFEDGSVKITGSENEVVDLINIGCRIIAIDGTKRIRESKTGAEFISYIKKNYKCIIMADISTIDEAIICADSGADCISTTLSGYTPETKSKNEEPDYLLVEKLANKINVPLFAEGRITTPSQAKKMIELGAWSVVVGSAITRPSVITKWFCDAIR